MNVMRNLLTGPIHLIVSEPIGPTVGFCRRTRPVSPGGMSSSRLVDSRMSACARLASSYRPSAGRSPFAEPHPILNERHDIEPVILHKSPGSWLERACPNAGRRSLP
jgi:hypothetical protein